MRSRALLRSIPVQLRSRRGSSGPTLGHDAKPVAPVAPAGAEPYSTACAAAAVQLRFEANGIVTTCCRTLQPLGHIGRDRLTDIWNGERRRRLESALEAWDFSEGCQPCGAEIELEGRGPSYAAIHDEFAVGLTADPATRAWPKRMEFNLSNSCNLQCIQCDGESSSSIRLHREHRPPLPEVYDDQFFEDLETFLPHLDHIVFAGGEPFMAAENYRVWELIARIAPHVTCKVVTNATQWNSRVRRAMDLVPLHFIFSLDGITKETYESIRIGADFDRVMENVDRFCDYVAANGTTASVNHCLMPQNYHEFGDLLAWAEDRGLFVNVSVVRTPAHACIAQLPADELRHIHRVMSEQDASIRPRLALNRATWERELGRIASWAASGDGDGDDLASRTVMWFRASGQRAHDDLDARAELAAFAADGEVSSVDVGGDDLITVDDLRFPHDPGQVIGTSFHTLAAVVSGRFGDMLDYEVMSTTDDRVDARARFGSTPARITTVALRDEHGHAEQARILIAFASAESD